MAASTYVKVKRDGTLTLKDGAANTYTVSYEQGDLKFSDAAADEVVIRDRGAIVGVRSGDSPVLSGSFNVHFREWTNAAANLIDVLQGVESASTWTKVDVNFEQWNLDINIIMETGTDAVAAQATLNTCIFKWDFSEGDPDNVAISFNCFAGITYAGDT